MSKRLEFTIKAKELARGLRPSKRVPRNSQFLISCNGSVGKDGTLSALDEIIIIDTSDITDVFPFPQLFVLTNMIIVCSSTKIYEWTGSLVEKLEVAAGSSWSVVDFYNYVYMSNGKVAVIRDQATGLYSETTELPTANSITDNNGQVIVGAPDTAIPGAGLSLNADVLTATLSQEGSWV